MKESLVDLFIRVEAKGPEVPHSALSMVDRILARKKGLQLLDEQARAPKGQSNGGQWVKNGGGSGALSIGQDLPAYGTQSESAAASDFQMMTGSNVNNYNKLSIDELETIVSNEHMAALSEYAIKSGNGELIAKLYSVAPGSVVSAAGFEGAMLEGEYVTKLVEMNKSAMVTKLPLPDHPSGVGVGLDEFGSMSKAQADSKLQSIYGLHPKIMDDATDPYKLGLMGEVELEAVSAHAYITGNAEVLIAISKVNMKSATYGAPLHEMASLNAQLKQAPTKLTSTQAPLAPIVAPTFGAIKTSALNSVATDGYTPEGIESLLGKTPAQMAQSDKVKLAQYKSALEAQVPFTMKVNPTGPKAMESFTTIGNKHNVTAVTAMKLATGEMEAVTHDEIAAKKDGLKYLKSGQVPKPDSVGAFPSAPPVKPTWTLPGSSKPLAVDPNSSATLIAMSQIAKGNGSHPAMKASTVLKLAKGEFKPDPSKPYQAVVAQNAHNYLTTGKLPESMQPKPAPTKGPGSVYTPQPITKASKGLDFNLSNDPPPITPIGPQIDHVNLGALTEEEKAAVRKYTTNYYTVINKNLGKDLVDPAVAGIDRALNQSRAKDNLTMVRGFREKAYKRLTGATGGSFVPGSVISDRSFISTTRQGHTAQAFAGYDGWGMKISVPKGARILPLRHMSAHAGEDEFLLPRDSKFLVTKYDAETKIVYVDLLT